MKDLSVRRGHHDNSSAKDTYIDVFHGPPAQRQPKMGVRFGPYVQFTCGSNISN